MAAITSTRTRFSAIALTGVGHWTYARSREKHRDVAGSFCVGVNHPFGTRFVVDGVPNLKGWG
jgi:hypothetical protein